MLWKDVGCGWFKYKDMEHRVNGSHNVWKMECEELQTGSSNYLIWSEVLFGEFLRWVSCPEIL